MKIILKEISNSKLYRRLMSLSNKEGICILCRNEKHLFNDWLIRNNLFKPVIDLVERYNIKLNSIRPVISEPELTKITLCSNCISNAQWPKRDDGNYRRFIIIGV